MAWVNILSIFFPVGAIYFSTVNISPASLVGGTWSQLTGGMLGLAGSDGVAAAGSNGGSRKITVNQLPAHHHTSSKWIVFDKGGWSKPASGHAAPDNGAGVSTPFGNDSLDSEDTGGARLYSCPHCRLRLETNGLKAVSADGLD